MELIISEYGMAALFLTMALMLLKVITNIMCYI